jgi:cell division protein FtsQ
VLVEPLDVKLMNMLSSLLIIGCIGLLSAGALWTLIKNPIFALTDIMITGDVQHNNAVTIKANVAPALLGNFFTLDLAGARRAFESVPWVRKAVVERRFPNQLLVQLEEHQAVAFWGSGADSKLLNSAGEVFVANTADLDNETMPRLLGPDAESAQVLAMYRSLSPQFEAVKLPIKEMELSGRGSWRITLDTGSEIELGRGSVQEVSVKVKRFLSTLTHVLGRVERKLSALESADLRHENGYAVRVRGLKTMDAPTRK